MDELPNDIKQCPGCKGYIEKTEGCDLIQCPCNIFFDWNDTSNFGDSAERVRELIGKSENERKRMKLYDEMEEEYRPKYNFPREGPMNEEEKKDFVKYRDALRLREKRRVNGGLKYELERQQKYDSMTPEDREKYTFPREGPMNEEEQSIYTKYKQVLRTRIKRRTGGGLKYDLARQEKYDAMTPEERNKYVFPREGPMNEEEKKEWDRYRNTLNKRAGYKKHKPVSEISEEERLRRNEVAREARERKQKKIAEMEENERRLAIEEERRKTRERAATRTAKNREERSEEEKQRHLELTSEMSAYDMIKYKFPRDIPPSCMNDYDRSEYDKWRSAVRSREKIARETEEKRAKRLKNQYDRVQHDKECMTEEERAEERKEHRKYMNEYNKKRRQENPEKMKKMYKESNRKRYLTEEDKERERKRKRLDYEKNKFWERERKRDEYHRKRGENIEKKKQVYEKNKEKERERKRDEYHRKRGENIEKNKQVYEKNKEKERERKRVEYKKKKDEELKECVICKQKLAWKFDECWGCRIGQKRIKRQEEEVKRFLEKNGIHASCENVLGCKFNKGDTRRYPDFVYVVPGGNYLVILEVDEDYHKNYTPECEISRLADIRDQYQCDLPILFIRYHPDRKIITGKNYSETGVIKEESKKELLLCFKAALKLGAPKEGELPHGYKLVFIGYPEERVKELASTREIMHHQAMEKIMSDIKNKTKEIARKNAFAKFIEKQKV